MSRDITIRLNGAALVAVLAVGVLALLVASSAAIADEPGVEYYACVTAGGDLSDVSIGEIPDCKKNKTLIHWNENGPAGPQGEPGVLEGVHTHIAEYSLAPGSSVEAYAWCDEGEVITGGGFIFGTGPAEGFADGNVLRASPNYNNSSDRWYYYVLAWNDNDTAMPLKVLAMCVPGSTSEPWLLPSVPPW